MEKQRTFSKRKKVVMFCLISVFTLMCAGGGLVHWLNNERSSINATQNTDTTSYVSVGEIWDSENESFNAINLSALLQYITGNEDITASDVASTKINQTRTSADIRTSTANGKTTSQDVQVTFGGLTWQVVHLTQDRSKNDIVTLWLSNNYQQAWEGRATNEGEHYGFIDGALYSDWSYNFYSTLFTVTYPSSLYGASYIHAVTLNNGGTYTTSTSAVTSQPAQQDSNSVFAMFTMDDVAGSVTKYLVTPSQVKYQETENANTQFGFAYYYPNEAYGEPNGSGSWSTRFGEAENITTNQYYDAWADDTLWLPSRTETGYSGTTGSSAGIWQTSTSQRASNNGSSSLTDMGKVGTASKTAYNFSWLRSGHYDNAGNAYLLFASGSDDYPNSSVTPSCAVRPALHLNLNSAASNAQYPPTTWDGSSTIAPSLQDTTQPNSEDNPYIIDTAAKLAWISANFDQPNCYGQHYLQTVDIDLASHPWTPINNVADTNSSNRRAYNYDGGNHTISNLYINTSEQTLTSNNYIGLFGYVYSSYSTHAYIKNLGIVGGSISGERYVGAVVGCFYYTDITNCYNEGVSVTGSSTYVGGIAGYYQSDIGIVSGCHNTGTVTSASTSIYSNVGGITGGGSPTNCYNTGAVSATGSDVGGITGSGSPNGCYNTGTVSSTSTLHSSNVGGITGEGSPTNCYNTGSVSSAGSDVGGISGSGHPVLCYNFGNVTGYNYVGGIVGIVDDGNVGACYSSAKVTGSTSRVGALVGGFMQYSSGITYYCVHSYYNKDLFTGNTKGTGLTLAEMTVTIDGIAPELMEGFFDAEWIFTAGQTPKLRMEDYSYGITEAPTLQDPNSSNSESNPYIIDTEAKLAYLSENSSWADEKYFLQTADLDFASYEYFIPINNSGLSYVYYYDGGDFTISNINIEMTRDYVGLFGRVSGSSSNHAYIRNVHLVNSFIGGLVDVGGIVGYGEYIDITNCSYNGEVVGGGNVGGIVGRIDIDALNTTININNNYNTGDISGDDNLGGIVGCVHIPRMYSSNSLMTINIINNYNIGKISGNNHIAGIFGYIYITNMPTSSSMIININNNYNTGDILGNSCIGGMVGYVVVPRINISNCFNTGNISGNASIAGIAGILPDNAKVMNCYNTGDISGTQYLGGIVGNVSGFSKTITISNCYNTGNISGSNYVGGIVGNVGNYKLSSTTMSNIITISSCFNSGAVSLTSGSSTYIGGVVGCVQSGTNYPWQHVSISWCYYNSETSGVAQAIGEGNGYQCYGLTTAQMQGTQNENWMYLSNSYWNFASGQYPTLKYVATAQN